MSFTLAGFKEGDGLRRFAFERPGPGKTKTTVVVRADVALARKHQIRLQELPLICVRLLDTLEIDALTGPVTLTEDHMIAIQNAARDAAEKRSHKPPRRPHTTPGQGWRAPGRDGIRIQETNQ